MITRAISIKQPFVELILQGKKKLEYRTVRTKIRERVYIYASLKDRPDGGEWKKARKKPGTLPKGVIVGTAFAATSGVEYSLPLAKQSHGLFTYYLLRKLKDTKGTLTLQKLKQYLEAEVPRASLIENGVKQTPQVLTAPDINEQWLNWILKN